ncbi:HEAT repeat domain-containing protein [Halosimplex amylolyticum]|uniref:HEAT repeat domain-containing protein n=1 Tax=Halosimplex amylolyticum TaxID=3396616 RepID=UPI003F555DED
MTRSLNDGADRAAKLREASTIEPETVDVTDVVDLLLHPDRRVRGTASDALERLVDARPGAIDGAVDRLAAHLDADDPDRRRRAALTVASLSGDHAEELARLVPRLATLGTDRSEPGREPAVLALAKIGIARPAAAVEAVDVLLGLSRDPLADATSGAGSPGAPAAGPDAPTAGHGTSAVGPGGSTRLPVGQTPRERDRARRDEVRVHAVAALARIATADPDAVRAATDGVADLLDDDHGGVRAAACEFLEAVAPEHPSAVEPAAPDLAERAVSDPKHPVPWRAADALGALGEERPEAVGAAVAPVAGDLDRFLESRDGDRRAAGAAFLAHAALVRPRSIEPQAATLEGLLSDERPPVRASAALALGRAERIDAREPIADLAENDPATGVRDAARRAREHLEGAQRSDE